MNKLKDSKKCQIFWWCSMFANLDSQLFIVQPTVHRYLPHMQAEQQQAVACTRHIRASVEKKDLRKPEFPVPRKWLVGERSDNVIPAQMDGCFQSYVFQCGNKIIWDFSTYGERQTADVSLAGAGTYRLFFLKSIARFLHKFEGKYLSEVLIFASTT